MLYFSEIHQKNPFGIAEMIASDGNRFVLTPENVLKVNLANRSIKWLFVETKNILKEIAQRVNC